MCTQIKWTYYFKRCH